MTGTPTLNGQDIGQADSADRAARSRERRPAVLDRLLARTGTQFHGWVILNLLGRSGGALGEDELTGQVVHGLKIGEDAVHAAAAELAWQGLISREPRPGEGTQVALTPPAPPASRRSRSGIARSPHACTAACPRRTWPSRTGCWPP